MSYALNALRGACSLSLQMGQALFPTIASTAIQAGLYDKRIGKIIAGTVLLGSGIGVIGKSGIPDTVLSLFSKPETTRDPQTFGKKCIRWGLAGAGLAMAGTGIYCIASGITELTSPLLRSTPDLVSSQPLEQEDAQALDMKECQKQLDRAIQSLSRCDATKNLLQDVQQEGNFTVSCVPKSQLNWPGAVNPQDRAIYVSTYFPPGSIREPMENIVVFELNNLKQSDSMLATQETMCLTDKYEYANAMEMIEYKTLESTNAIVASCVDEGIWKSRKEQTPDTTHYLADRAVSGHIMAYQLQWTELCNPQGLKGEIQWIKFLQQSLGYSLPPNFNKVVANIPIESQK